MSEPQRRIPPRRSIPRRAVALAGTVAVGGVRLLLRAVVAPDAPLARAVRARRSGAIVEFRSRVHKILPDDTTDPPHQRFLIQLSGNRDATVLIAHNTVLAPRVPIRPGDRVHIKGQYEWNDLGGVVHWTHRDPGGNGNHPHGWISHWFRKYE